MLLKSFTNFDGAVAQFEPIFNTAAVREVLGAPHVQPRFSLADLKNIDVEALLQNDQDTLSKLQQVLAVLGMFDGQRVLASSM